MTCFYSGKMAEVLCHHKSSIQPLFLVGTLMTWFDRQSKTYRYGDENLSKAIIKELELGGGNAPSP